MLAIPDFVCLTLERITTGPERGVPGFSQSLSIQASLVIKVDHGLCAFSGALPRIESTKSVAVVLELQRGARSVAQRIGNRT